MSKYVILTDSTSDIPQPLVAKYNLDYIPMEVNFGEETFRQYLDERELKLSDFYARLDNKELATTTLINMQTYIEKFTPYLEKGLDIIFIGISSALSASYGQALMAREELYEQFPGSNIAIIDSKGASVAEGALVVEALEKQKDGMSFADVVDHIEKLIKHVIAFFVPINLDTLRRGGRIGAVKAVIGDAIGIKPILKLDDEGKIVELSKARGFKRALVMLVELAKDRIKKPYDQKFYIVHASNSAAATVVADLFTKEHGGGQPIIGPLGPVISAHTGTGAVCLVFFGSHR